jgi:hypothetical protein
LVTSCDAAAIVNAADEAMQHGGGVAGAIVAAGGKEIQVESDEWVAKHGRVLTGSGCAVTGAGSLPCKHVIHVVGPVWSEQLEGETLARGEVVSLDGKGGFTALTEEVSIVILQNLHPRLPDPCTAASHSAYRATPANVL